MLWHKQIIISPQTRLHYSSLAKCRLSTRATWCTLRNSSQWRERKRSVLSVTIVRKVRSRSATLSCSQRRWNINKLAMHTQLIWSKRRHIWISINRRESSRFKFSKLAGQLMVSRPIKRWSRGLRPLVRHHRTPKSLPSFPTEMLRLRVPMWEKPLASNDSRTIPPATIAASRFSPTRLSPRKRLTRRSDSRSCCNQPNLTSSCPTSLLYSGLTPEFKCSAIAHPSLKCPPASRKASDAQKSA